MGREQLIKNWSDKYIGKTYNYLTIIQRNNNYKKQHNIKSNASYYKCQCKCGKYKTVRITAITSGEVKSCGCLKKEQEKKNLVHGYNLIDLTGKTFGLLTVLYKDQQQHDEAFWVCQCRCGKQITTRSSSLRNGNTISCGCKKMSKNEIIIADILKENNIVFLYNMPYFSDLLLPGGGIGKYDFILLDKQKHPYRLIQYDGIQHNLPINYFGGEDKLEKTKISDNIKNKYAIQHNLPLVRIPHNVIPTYNNIFSNQYEVKE